MYFDIKTSATEGRLVTAFLTLWFNKLWLKDIFVCQMENLNCWWMFTSVMMTFSLPKENATAVIIF